MITGPCRTEVVGTERTGSSLIKGKLFTALAGEQREEA